MIPRVLKKNLPDNTLVKFGFTPESFTFTMMERNECRRWEAIAGRERPVVARNLSAEFEERFDESMRSLEEQQDEDDDDDIRDPSFSDDLTSLSSCAETPTDDSKDDPFRRLANDKSTNCRNLSEILPHKVISCSVGGVRNSEHSSDKLVQELKLKKCKAKQHLKGESVSDDNEDAIDDFGDDMDYEEIDDDEIGDDDEFEDEEDEDHGANFDEVSGDFFY